MNLNKLKNLLLPLCIAVSQVYAQNNDSTLIDAGAVTLMDKMSSIIGELESCSFSLALTQDVTDHDDGFLTRHSSHKVFLKGPDKMQVISQHENGRKSLWYDGNDLWYYSFTENNYSHLGITGNLISVIDSLYFKYGVEFPAADLFYPAFTDDVLQGFSEIRLIGITEVEGKSCFHIVARKEAQVLQLWIENNAFFLPVKYTITDHTQSVNYRYEAIFDIWVTNPDLPDALFMFSPPKGAKPILMLAKE